MPAVPLRSSAFKTQGSLGSHSTFTLSAPPPTYLDRKNWLKATIDSTSPATNQHSSFLYCLNLPAAATPHTTISNISKNNNIDTRIPPLPLSAQESDTIMICDQTSLSVCRSVVMTPSVHLSLPSLLTTFITLYLPHVSQIPHMTLMTNAFIASGMLSFPQSWCSLQSSFAL